MPHISDDAFREWDLFGAGKLMKLQWIRPDWPLLPFRAPSFQKANLPCVILSVCDLGQALSNAPVLLLLLLLLQTPAEEKRQHALSLSPGVLVAPTNYN